MNKFGLLLICTLATIFGNSQDNANPLRVGIAGLTHGHVHWILARAHDGDIEIVGIAEKNKELATRLLKQYKLSEQLLYSSLEDMLAKSKPEAVTGFGSTYEHLEVVQACAPKKIHVMVEKPLAVSLDHAKKMEALATKHQIHLLTNYETTWYGSNYKLYNLFYANSSYGQIRKIVVQDGHEGPKEIGVNKEFFEWLTDPVKNGGGAVMDFGCYGANLITWLLKGKRPVSIFAVTQQFKPAIYPKVDDEATIVVAYPGCQGIIQASWNWPYGRKDMEVYGETGYVIADRMGIKFKSSPEAKEVTETISPPEKPHHDPFAYLKAVVRGEISIQPTDLSSLQNNMVVMEILEAAKRSAKEGKVVYLNK
jgi:predicted dehydrogenase